MATTKPTVTALLILALCLLPAAAQETPRGKLTGGATHAMPDWFKQSFLEIREDVDEASRADKHLMLFFQLDDCPYCERMLRESFETEPLHGFIRQHFDVIAINVRGDREMVFDAQTTLSEKRLAEQLEVAATPAILFLDSNYNTVTRVNGYRSPERFRHILRYVNDKAYRQMPLAVYLDNNLARNVYTLRDHRLFARISDLSAVAGPLAVILEDASCHDCAEFHERTLARGDVQEELRKFTVVRLDTDAEHAIIDVDGSRTTAKGLAAKYAMSYRPGVLIFDQRKLVRRYDSLLYHHHFKEGLRYISGGYYKTQGYREYADKRLEDLLSQGVDVDLGR